MTLRVMARSSGLSCFFQWSKLHGSPDDISGVAAMKTWAAMSVTAVAMSTTCAAYSSLSS